MATSPPGAFAVLSAVGALLAACGHGATSATTTRETASAPVARAPAPTAAGPTALDVVLDNGYFGSASYTLRCAPPGGTMPGAAAACARLADNPAALTRSVGLGEVPGETGTQTMSGPVGSIWSIHVTGTVDGAPVDATTTAFWSTRYAPVVGILGLAADQVIGDMGRGIIEVRARPATAADGRDPAYWVEVAGPLSAVVLAPQRQTAVLGTPPGRVTVRVSEDDQFSPGRILCRTSFTQPRDALTRVRVDMDGAGACRIARPSSRPLPAGAVVPKG